MGSLAVALTVSSALALELNGYFTDNMVVQREKPIQIRGSADTGEKVTVSFAGQTKTGVTGEEGKWAITLDPMPASDAGRVIRIQSSGTGQPIAIRNVVVGDVFLFARQSSVDVSLGRDDKGRKIASAYKANPFFRAIRVTAGKGGPPLEDFGPGQTTGWVQVDKRTGSTLSGAAFYLGDELANDVKVPIGMIDADMRHYFPMSWLSKEGIRESTELYGAGENGPAEIAEILAERAEAYEAGGWTKRGEPPIRPPQPALLHPLEHPLFPSACYNSVIAPLRGVAVKGILMQVGANYPYIAYAVADAAGRGRKVQDLAHAWGMSYEIQRDGFRMDPKTVPLIPRVLRDAFSDPELPIGIVIPPGSDLGVLAVHNREMRELQRRISAEDPSTGVIMPPAGNIPMSGQPSDDRGVAERCRLWLLGKVYKKAGVVPTGPLFDRAETSLSTATVFFKEGTAEGLRDRTGALGLFEVAGPDKTFFPANAQIDGSSITLTSGEVNNIQAIRFNWGARPDQGLVNAAGLPALPFNFTGDYRYFWLINNADPDLPDEYRTPANEWDESDVAIINGSVDDTYIPDWEPRPSHLGPTGIRAAEFGPNLAVIKTEPGTPAHGRLFGDDVIYSANGKMLGFDQHRVFGEAITESETEAMGGKLTLGIRRGGKTIDVELQLKVMGSYSSSTPYHCPKSRQIIADAEAWVVERMENGTAGSGMLGTDVWFLLASGNPEHQGLVRRAVYRLIDGIDPNEKLDPYTTRVKNWNAGYSAVLLGEYFHATGDRNVLPHLKKLAEKVAMSQVKPPVDPPLPSATSTDEEQVGGWFHNYPGGGNPEYGFMELAGMACVTGMALAKEAGLQIDEQAFEWGLRHFRKGRGEFAHITYRRSDLRRSSPKEVDPEAEANGMLRTYNGKLAAAAVMFKLVGDERTAEVCSRHCVYSFNRTYYGHGGAFFNNFWTPIGAHTAGRKGFIHFMKGQTWYRELFRRHDGSMRQTGRGGIGVGYAMAYVAPGQRLRMLGAPPSAFGADPPEALKAALAAHQERNYSLCEKLTREALESAVLSVDERRRGEHMLNSVQNLQASIDHDLARMAGRIEAGDYYRASLDLPQLRAVVSPDNTELVRMGKILTSKEGLAQIKKSERELKSQLAHNKEATKPASPGDDEAPTQWLSLTTKVFGNEKKPEFGGVPETDATRWRMKVVESMAQAPEGWTDEGFDDSDWDVTPLPTTWRMYHTALLRAKFEVGDVDMLEKLRIRGRFFRQLNIRVYINGTLVAKIDQTSKSPVAKELTELARRSLHDGENTICITTRHNWRWASRMHYATGVDFTLDAGRKDTLRQ